MSVDSGLTRILLLSVLGGLAGFLASGQKSRPKPSSQEHSTSNDTLNDTNIPHDQASLRLTQGKTKKDGADFHWMDKPQPKVMQQFIMDKECRVVLDQLEANAKAIVTLSEEVKEALPLPLFEDQLHNIMTAVAEAKLPLRPLLVEGLPGIGKGLGLLTLARSESTKRPAVFVSLAKVLDTKMSDSTEFRHPVSTLHGTIHATHQDLGNWAGCLAQLLPAFLTHDGPMFGLNEQREQDLAKRSEFRMCIEKALGASPWLDRKKLEEKSSSFTSFEPPAEGFQSPMDSRPPSSRGSSPSREILPSLRLITKALQQRFLEWESKSGHIQTYLPPILVVDDVQVLFNGKGNPRDDRWDDIETVFEWLLNLQTHGLLDLVVCSEGRSVASAFRRIPGYEHTMRNCMLEGVEDEIVATYLVEKINPLIEDGFKKFSPREAMAFAEAFGGNLLEIEAFVNGEGFPNVHSYIGSRQEDYHKLISFILSSHPRFRADAPDSLFLELQSFILAMMMNGGKILMQGNEHWSRKRWEVVECLLELRLIRWELNNNSRSGSRSSLDAQTVANTLRTMAVGLSDGVSSHFDSDDENDVDVSDLSLVFMGDMIANAMIRFFNLGM